MCNSRDNQKQSYYVLSVFSLSFFYITIPVDYTSVHTCIILSVEQVVAEMGWGGRTSV